MEVDKFTGRLSCIRPINKTKVDNIQSGKPTISSGKGETIGNGEIIGNGETTGNGETRGLYEAGFAGFDERFTGVMFITGERDSETKDFTTFSGADKGPNLESLVLRTIRDRFRVLDRG